MLYDAIALIIEDEVALYAYMAGVGTFVLACLIFSFCCSAVELIVALIRRFIYPGKKKED